MDLDWVLKILHWAWIAKCSGPLISAARIDRKRTTTRSKNSNLLPKPETPLHGSELIDEFRLSEVLFDDDVGAAPHSDDDSVDVGEK